MTATWVVKGNLKGPKGDKGETGPAGPKGDGSSLEAGSCIEINDNTISVKTASGSLIDSNYVRVSVSSNNYPIIGYDKDSFVKTGNDDEQLALRPATQSTLGGVIVGEGLSINVSNGMLSVTNPLRFADEATAKSLLGY